MEEKLIRKLLESLQGDSSTKSSSSPISIKNGKLVVGREEYKLPTNNVVRNTNISGFR